MALADLMRKGFLTSATATSATVATDTVGNSSSVATVATVAVAAVYNAEVQTHSVATVATVAVAKAQTVRSNTDMAQWRIDLVAEFMEIDGMNEADALAMAAISVQPRSEAAWLMLVTELDALIERYVAANGLPQDVQARLLGARSRQSLASIPDSITWFKAKLDGAGTDQRPDDSPQGGSDGQA